MDILPDDLREVYLKYGRTAEMAQVLELEAGNLALAFLSVWFNPEKITDAQRQVFESVINDVDRRTLGNLLVHIRKAATISEDIETTISEALEKRNYLVHKFFKTHNFAINSEKGRLAMSAELDEIFHALSSAHAILSGMTHTLNGVFGGRNISSEEVLALMNEGERVQI